MGASFSKTAYDRLPACIRRLEKNAQTVCIHLRLRKAPDKIASEMGLSPDEVQKLEDEVRRTLIATGNYDIVCDPQFVPIGGEGGAEPAADAYDNESMILAKNFVVALRGAMAALPHGERRLLHLFFERHMTAGEILAFLSLADTALDCKPPKTPADVFNLLDKALQKLLGSVSAATPIGRGTLTVKGLKEVLWETGVDAA